MKKRGRDREKNRLCIVGILYREKKRLCIGAVKSLRLGVWGKEQMSTEKIYPISACFEL